MTVAMRTLALTLMTCLVITRVPAQTPVNDAIAVDNPDRSFGYTVGDRLEQRIMLLVPDKEDEFIDLPLIQREGRWVERQQVALDESKTTLLLRYQIINSPTTTRTISLPSLELYTSQGTLIAVPEWRFSVAPLIPVASSEEPTMAAIQADWSSAPEAAISTRLSRDIKLFCGALAFLLLSWVGWSYMRTRQELRSLPFARAYHIIQDRKPGAKTDYTETAWLALHRAFDHQCGRVVDRSSVASLMQSSDWLAPLESDIRQFFESSSKRFYSNATPEAMLNLEDFAKRLSKAEKRNTSDLRFMAMQNSINQ